MKYIAIPTKAITKVRGAEKPSAVITGTSRSECRRIIVMCEERIEDYTIFPVSDTMISLSKQPPRARRKLTKNNDI